MLKYLTNQSESILFKVPLLAMKKHTFQTLILVSTLTHVTAHSEL